MTKEELDEKYPMNKIPDAVRKAAVAWGKHLFIRDKVKLAQDMMVATEEYRKQECISFAEWINGEMYECFLHTDENVKFWHDVHGNGSYTTEELYTKFLTDQSK